MNNNLIKIEELRDEEEVKSYFKGKGINLTNKELIKLKEHFNSLESEGKKLTHQQLNAVAGGGLSRFSRRKYKSIGTSRKRQHRDHIRLQLVHPNQDARQMEDETAVGDHNLPSEVRQDVLRQHPGDPSTTARSTQTFEIPNPANHVLTEQPSANTQKNLSNREQIIENSWPRTIYKMIKWKYFSDDFNRRFEEYVQQLIGEPAHKSRITTTDNISHANIQASSVSEVQTEESCYEDQRNTLITPNPVPSKESQKSNPSIVSSWDKSTISETIFSSGHEESTADAASRSTIHTPTETTPTVLSKHPAEIPKKPIEQSNPQPGTSEVAGAKDMVDDEAARTGVKLVGEDSAIPTEPLTSPAEAAASPFLETEPSNPQPKNPEAIAPEMGLIDTAATASHPQLPSKSTINELFTTEGRFRNKRAARIFNRAISAKFVDPKTGEAIIDPETGKTKLDLDMGEQITITYCGTEFTFVYNGWAIDETHYYRQFTVTWTENKEEKRKTIRIVIPANQRTNVIQRLDNIVGGIFEEGKEALKRPVVIALNAAISAQLVDPKKVDLAKGDKIILKERLPGYTFVYEECVYNGFSYYMEFTVTWKKEGKKETRIIYLKKSKKNNTSVEDTAKAGAEDMESDVLHGEEMTDDEGPVDPAEPLTNPATIAISLRTETKQSNPQPGTSEVAGAKDMVDDEAARTGVKLVDEDSAIPTEPLTSPAEATASPFLETEPSNPQPENPEAVALEIGSIDTKAILFSKFLEEQFNVKNIEDVRSFNRAINEQSKGRRDLKLGKGITINYYGTEYTFVYDGWVWVRGHGHNCYWQFTVTWKKEGKKETRTIRKVIPENQRTNVIQRLDNIVGGIFEEGKEALKRPVVIALNAAISAQLVDPKKVDLAKGDKIILKERLPGYTFVYEGCVYYGFSYYRKFTVTWKKEGKKETRIIYLKKSKKNTASVEGTAKAGAEKHSGCNMRPNKRQKTDVSANFSTCYSSPTGELPHPHNIPAAVLELLGGQTLINEATVDQTEPLTRSAETAVLLSELPSKSTINKLFTTEGRFRNRGKIGDACIFNIKIRKKLKKDPKTGESRDDLSIGERIECFGYEFIYVGKYYDKKMGKNCRRFIILYSEDGELKSMEIRIRIPDKKITKGIKVAALPGNKMEDVEAIAPEAIVDDEDPVDPAELLTRSAERATVPTEAMPPETQEKAQKLHNVKIAIDRITSQFKFIDDTSSDYKCELSGTEPLFRLSELGEDIIEKINEDCLRFEDEIRGYNANPEQGAIDLLTYIFDDEERAKIFSSPDAPRIIDNNGCKIIPILGKGDCCLIAINVWLHALEKLGFIDLNNMPLYASEKDRAVVFDFLKFYLEKHPEKITFYGEALIEEKNLDAFRIFEYEYKKAEIMRLLEQKKNAIHEWDTEAIIRLVSDVIGIDVGFYIISPESKEQVTCSSIHYAQDITHLQIRGPIAIRFVNGNHFEVVIMDQNYDQLRKLHLTQQVASKTDHQLIVKEPADRKIALSSDSSMSD